MMNEHYNIDTTTTHSSVDAALLLLKEELQHCLQDARGGGVLLHLITGAGVAIAVVPLHVEVGAVGVVALAANEVLAWCIEVLGVLIIPLLVWIRHLAEL